LGEHPDDLNYVVLKKSSKSIEQGHKDDMIIDVLKIEFVFSAATLYHRLIIYSTCFSHAILLGLKMKALRFVELITISASIYIVIQAYHQSIAINHQNKNKR
jgi:hypothetical protein